MFKSSQSFQGKARQYSRKGTFADLLIRHVRDRGGDAPSVYTAAWIDRRTYSSIVSHPFRPVSKRTAIQFALALHLKRPDADALLLSAGYALSPSIPAALANHCASKSRHSVPTRVKVTRTKWYNWRACPIGDKGKGETE